MNIYIYIHAKVKIQKMGNTTLKNCFAVSYKINSSCR